MKTMTASEASRGFSTLLDAIERGESVTVTRSGRAVAEIRPAAGITGRHLRLALEARDASRLDDDDADEMLRSIRETNAMLTTYKGAGWVDG